MPKRSSSSLGVSRLREVLRDDDQSIVKTVHGYGYRFAAEIEMALPKPAVLPAR